MEHPIDQVDLTSPKAFERCLAGHGIVKLGGMEALLNVIAGSSKATGKSKDQRKRLRNRAREIVGAGNCENKERGSMVDELDQLVHLARERVLTEIEL